MDTKMRLRVDWPDPSKSPRSPENWKNDPGVPTAEATNSSSSCIDFRFLEDWTGGSCRVDQVLGSWLSSGPLKSPEKLLWLAIRAN